MKYCPDCGSENIDEAQFCRNCGLKFTQEIKKEVSEVSTKPQINTQSNPILDNSIVRLLFFKTDKYTGEIRFGKVKITSIVVFVLMFALALAVGGSQVSFFVYILSAIIFALLFAVPTYVIGFIIGIVVDKIQNG